MFVVSGNVLRTNVFGVGVGMSGGAAAQEIVKEGMKAV
jgi:hypothetical protein